MHQAIDAALKPAPYGLEQNSHESRGRERDGNVALRLEEGSEGYHRKHIDPDDAGAKRTVYEGAVYDYVYVVEVVLQDGDVGEDWNDEQSQYRHITYGPEDLPQPWCSAQMNTGVCSEVGDYH